MTPHSRPFLTVKIRREVIPALERLIKDSKDSFGVPLFRSKSDAVTQAVREFLVRNAQPNTSRIQHPHRKAVPLEAPMP